MTHGSLFSGIGGFDLAAEWMGWTNLFNCEINSFCRKILKYHFPDAKQYTDIRTVDFTVWRGRIDVLSGGFPCQPFSVAGKRKGTDDNRYLWTEMLRAIREIQPSWIVGENVAGILSMVQPGSEVAVAREESLFGKVDRERVLHRQEYVVETICRDLEREGYSVQSFVIPACAVGAPHRRDRVWIAARLVADTDSDRQRHGQDKQEPIAECERTSNDRNGCKNGLVADTLRTGRQELNAAAEPGEALLADSESDARRLAANADEYGHTPRQACERAESGGRRHVSQPCEWGDEAERPDGLPRLQRSAAHAKGQQGERPGLEQRSPCQSEQGELGGGGREDCYELPDRWRDFPTQSPICCRDDGFPDRLDGIAFPKWRSESIKAYGNAIVP